MRLLHTRAYLINLRHRRDRLRYAEAQLATIGWPYERFEAIKPTDPEGYTTTGSRGCTESHFTLLRQAADQGNEPTLIMEDDLKPCDDFHDAVEAFHRAIAARVAQADILYYFNEHSTGKQGGGFLESPTICTHFYVALNPRKLLALRDGRTVIDQLYVRGVETGSIRALSPTQQIVTQNLKCGTDLGSSHSEFKARVSQFNRLFVNG